MACEQLHINWNNKFHEWAGASDTSSTVEYRSNYSPVIMSTRWYLNYISAYLAVTQHGIASTLTLRLSRENYGKKLQIKGILYYPFSCRSDIPLYNLDCIMESDAKHVTIFERLLEDVPSYSIKLTCIAWITELIEKKEQAVQTRPNFSKLLCHMHEMYEKQIHSDLIVICEDAEIRVHKCVLSARSPVLAKMFEHATTKSYDNRIIIEDIDPVIFKELLKFLYCGYINRSLYSRAHDLYCAAEKYFVSDLKDFCHDLIISSLSIKTAVKTLILAYRHKDEEMKQKAITFIVSSFQGVKSTNAWMFLQNDAGLATDVISVVAEKIAFPEQ